MGGKVSRLSTLTFRPERRGEEKMCHVARSQVGHHGRVRVVLCLSPVGPLRRRLYPSPGCSRVWRRRVHLTVFHFPYHSCFVYYFDEKTCGTLRARTSGVKRFGQQSCPAPRILPQPPNFLAIRP